MNIFMGTNDIHSQVLMILLTGTASMPHEYWWASSRLLMSFLAATEGSLYRVMFILPLPAITRYKLLHYSANLEFGKSSN